MQRRWLMLVAGAMLSTVIAGCSDNHGELGNRNIRQQSVREDGNGNLIVKHHFANDLMNERNRMNGRRLNSNNIIGSHRNYQLDMNVMMSERLSAMDGIGQAYVMLTDHNAYVAITSDDNVDNAPGPSSLSVPGQIRPLSRTDMAYLPPGTHLKQRSSMQNTMSRSNYEHMQSGRHMNAKGRFDSTKSYDSTKITRIPTQSPSPSGGGIVPYAAGAAQMPTYGYRSSKEYDMYGSGYQPVRPYSALGTAPHNLIQLSSGEKDRISAELKKLDSSIEHVFVSSDADFVGRMSAYYEDIRLGHPIQAYIAEFNALVERVFPAQPAGRR